jgi:hypothetical protein
MRHPGAALTRDAALSAAASLTGSATLVCCVLPAVLVALGAGAALAGLVTAVPLLIWLSEHKPLVFGTTGGMLIASGAALGYGRSLASPADLAAAGAIVDLPAFHVAAWAYAHGARLTTSLWIESDTVEHLTDRWKDLLLCD